MKRLLLAIASLASACGGGSSAVTDDAVHVEPPPPPEGSFGHDLAFLEAHVPDLVVLADPDSGARVAVAPLFQGRVMTSTGAGRYGPSFGWINRALIESGERRPHMNAFGGEDRFWLGPEGSRNSLYFAPGDPMDLQHWQVPEVLDWGAWAVAGKSETEVSFQQEIRLTNYAGTELSLRVDRTIRLLSQAVLGERLGTTLAPGVDAVAYESVNVIENMSDAPLTQESGLPSIWILGMYRPSDEAVVVVPYTPGPEEQLGAVVNDAYFGEVPEDRLHVGEQAVFFRADGAARGKIGVGPRRAQPILGAWDGERRALTLVQYTVPEGDDEDDAVYVNSLWDPDAPPYEGDVINSYNDGPTADGGPPLGPFYELETSSPAAALAPGESLRHVHRTFHLTGSREALEEYAQTFLGVDLLTIEDAFYRR